MTTPPIPSDDGLDLSISERLEQAAELLRQQPDTGHPELWKLLSLAAYRTARLESCENPDWGHLASSYLTLNTLRAHLSTTDYFGHIPPIAPNGTSSA